MNPLTCYIELSLYPSLSFSLPLSLCLCLSFFLSPLYEVIFH